MASLYAERMDAYSRDAGVPAASALLGLQRSRNIWPRFAALAVAALAAAIQALWIPIDGDVSWLITACERLLSGGRLYVDVVEVNPPASVWMYVPAVWAAKLAGIRPEAAVVSAFIAGGLASVYATVRLASKLDDAPNSVVLASALCLIALVFPMGLFAQKEHAALLLALPAVAAMAVIAEGKPLSRATIGAGGLAAGLVVVIKPYFLLAMVPPALWAVWKRRSLSPFLPGIVAAALAIGLYLGAIALFARAFFNWLPVFADIYASMHELWWKALLGPLLFPFACLLLAVLIRPRRTPSLAVAWALAAAGFLVAAWAQAKNYPNHWLPESALALAAAFTMLLQPGLARTRRIAVGAALAAASLCVMNYWAIVPDPAVAAAIERVAAPNPRIAALSTQLTTGHPVTRNVGGHWIGSRPALFLAAAARFAGLHDPLARRAYRDDIQSFAVDVRRSSPDVVLVDTPTQEWLLAEPAIAGVMRDYRPVDRVGKTEIWVRRSPAR